MPFNNFVKHPNRHAGPDPVSRTQWNYWFPANRLCHNSVYNLFFNNKIIEKAKKIFTLSYQYDIAYFKEKRYGI
ncbi:MAG: hypothetical protein KJ826_04160 [Proteobacteria bacterium]|nr:hypothetical protein [Pseudomonadota bacterium]